MQTINQLAAFVSINQGGAELKKKLL